MLGEHAALLNNAIAQVRHVRSHYYIGAFEHDGFNAEILEVANAFAK
jgi:hypothetical protein